MGSGLVYSNARNHNSQTWFQREWSPYLPCYQVISKDSMMGIATEKILLDN